MAVQYSTLVVCEIINPSGPTPNSGPPTSSYHFARGIQDAFTLHLQAKYKQVYN